MEIPIHINSISNCLYRNEIAILYGLEPIIRNPSYDAIYLINKKIIKILIRYTIY